MKVCAISDLHGRLPAVPDCDLLLIGGDICPNSHEPEPQARWLDTEFRPWLETVHAQCDPVIVGIAGNHDAVFYKTAPECAFTVPDRLRWVYLQDNGIKVRIRGKGPWTIWGTPWSMNFDNWYFMGSDAELAGHYAKIPEGTDILLAHGPPHGYGDQVYEGHAFVSVGSVSLLKRIREIKPTLTIFGHIHEGRGTYCLDGSEGGIVMANATLTGHWGKSYEPMIFNLPDKGAISA